MTVPLGNADCHICGRGFEPCDVAAFRSVASGVKPVHMACGQPGVRRWLRQGRPLADPLRWDRVERPRWQSGQQPPGSEPVPCGEPAESRVVTAFDR